MDTAGEVQNTTHQQKKLAEAEEKVAQMAGTTPLRGAYGSELWNVPGVERLGVPPFKMSDGPRGVGVGDGRTAFPVAMARGASWDPDLERRVGEAMGRELRAIGGNVLLAPAINNLRHPSWGRSQETYGEDPYHLGEMGAALVNFRRRCDLVEGRVDLVGFQLGVDVLRQVLDTAGDGAVAGNAEAVAGEVAV